MAHSPVNLLTVTSHLLLFICSLNQWLSTCGSQTSISSVTWELVQNANYRASHPQCLTDRKVKPRHLISPLDGSDAYKEENQFSDLQRICVCLQ